MNVQTLVDFLNTDSNLRVNRNGQTELCECAERVARSNEERKETVDAINSLDLLKVNPSVLNQLLSFVFRAELNLTEIQTPFLDFVKKSRKKTYDPENILKRGLVYRYLLEYGGETNNHDVFSDYALSQAAPFLWIDCLALLPKTTDTQKKISEKIAQLIQQDKDNFHFVKVRVLRLKKVFGEKVEIEYFPKWENGSDPLASPPKPGDEWKEFMKLKWGLSRWTNPLEETYGRTG